MEFIRKLGVVESIVALNFLSFLAIWYLDGGLYNSKQGLVFAVDVMTFVPWLVTAIPAIAVSIYGLLNMDHLYADDRTKRLAVCSICLVANAVFIGAMTIPNSLFIFQITNLYSIGR
jgi:4-amino-4-deoxy-L-arabinose transferase-like glycosyltransferase